MNVSTKRALQVALVIAVAVVVASFLRRAPEHEMAAQPGHASATAAPRATARIVPTPRRSSAAPVAAAQPDAQTFDPMRVDDFQDNPLADVIRRIVDADPQLKKFMYWHHRPLLDEPGRAQYHTFLADRGVMADVAHDLLYPDEAVADQASNIKRLMKIDYLRAALAWKENPEREAILDLICEMILTDNYPPDMAMDMRLSLSGNKLELYALLDEYAPERAAALAQTARGTRLEALIAHISNSNTTRKQREAELDTEVAITR